MNVQTRLHFISTILLMGICACVPEDIEQPLDELDEEFDAELDEIDSHEPETAQVSADPLKADFNNDGYADLAIGAPGKTISGVASGAVTVLYGSGNGLRSINSQVLVELTSSGYSLAEAGDEFGFALAAGDFNADGFADLAVGAPSDAILGIRGAGSVTVFNGTANGLSSVGALFFHQGLISNFEAPESEDEFGYALSAGDFDGDGDDDLAIGVPREDLLGVADAGFVHVLTGSPLGLTRGIVAVEPAQDLVVLGDLNETGDLFGAALSAGDFNSDGKADLAIGVPGEDLGSVTDAGLIHVLYGVSVFVLNISDLPSGGAPPAEIWQQNTPGIPGFSEPGDEFGEALAAGDFDNDGSDDLAVGAPGEDVGTINRAGAVTTIYGTVVGLLSNGSEVWNQNTAGVNGRSEPDDFFGEKLAAGDLDGDGHDDLAIGVPGEDLGGVPDAGSVNVLYGTGGGITASDDQEFNQGTSGILGSVEAFDKFASALTIGDFDRNNAADLAIGVPYEDVGLTADAGQVNVIYGDIGTGLTANGDQVFHQDVANVPEGAEPGDLFGAAVR